MRVDIWPALDRCQYRLKETDPWQEGRLMAVLPAIGSAFAVVIETVEGNVIKMNINRSESQEDCSGYIKMRTREV